MVAMPSSKNRRRLEVPNYYYDAIKKIAETEDRTMINVVGELIFSGLQNYQKTWGPREHVGQWLTARARRVFEVAQTADPAQFNHNYVGTEHLLLALTEDADGLAGRVLARYGVTAPVVRQAIEAIIGRGDCPVKEKPELTPRARKVLALSVAEAKRLDHNFVGTVHLLLGLVRESEGIAAGILERNRVDLKDLRDASVQALASREVPLAET
jgi:ATP-dependent Clp protease ATP-binding subunit ClpC